MKYIKQIFDFPAPLKVTFPLIWLLPFLVLVSADLGTKKYMTDVLTFNLQYSQLAQHKPLPQESLKTLAGGKSQIDVLGQDGKYIKFRLVFNDKFAFSLGFAHTLFSFFVSLFAIIFLFFYRAHNPDLGHPLAWLSIFSGAFGNLIDKMFVKSLVTREWTWTLLPQKGAVTGVVDFIECIWFGVDSLRGTLLGFLSWPTWPTFNVADSLVSTGIVLLLLTMKFRD